MILLMNSRKRGVGMSKLKFILLLIVMSLLLNSCSSIYTEDPIISQNVAIEVDPSTEYFTEGNVVSCGNNNGLKESVTFKSLDTRKKLALYQTASNKLN